MKILNFGSLNIDFVYSTPHFVAPGETLSSSKLEKFCGGKGLNQSVALAKAGAQTYHAGFVGNDAEMLLNQLKKAGADLTYTKTVDVPTGHAIIEVDPSGENRIILFGGANQVVDEKQATEVLSHFDAGDYLLLQNEIAMTPFLAKAAHRKGMKVVLNPSPYNDKIKQIDLNDIDMVILNETEGEMMTGKQDYDTILAEIKRLYPKMEVVLTLGKGGSVYSGKNGLIRQKIINVGPAVDTTGAGDTFTGFYLASLMSGKDEGYSLRLASAASGISVTRNGASTSIPTLEEATAAANA